MLAASCRSLTKVYQKGRFDVKALDALDLEIPHGQFLALMGPSGSGKSTLLHLLGGLDSPSSGELVVAGSKLHSMSESQLTTWRSKHVGFIFQQYHLVPVLNAADNVELPLLLFKGMSSSERRKRVELALDIVGLKDRMDHKPNMLSGGQEQRVAIARAIVTDPDIILADEPTGDLDAQNAEEILALLNMLNEHLEKTIVMVTHDPKAASHAARQLHLEKGIVVHDMDPTAEMASRQASMV